MSKRLETGMVVSNNTLYIRKGRIGQKVAEKHGLHWTHTSFAEAASELTKEEITQEDVLA